jgi:hypothetical protein
MISPSIEIQNSDATDGFIHGSSMQRRNYFYTIHPHASSIFLKATGMRRLGAPGDMRVRQAAAAVSVDALDHFPDGGLDQVGSGLLVALPACHQLLVLVCDESRASSTVHRCKHCTW